MDRRTLGKLALGFAGASAMGGVRLASAAEKLKVGFLYTGPIGDHGYSFQHDQGRKEMEAALGDKVSTSFVENVPEGADAERVVEQLASSGHKLIFSTSFGFMNPTLKVAQRHPDVFFEHATGYKRAKNLATYAGRFYEGRAVVGTIVAKMTKSNLIGYIGAFPIPEVVNGINAFTIALKAVNPKAEVRVVWANTWYDPGKEADAAKALIGQGCDVILQHTDSPAAVQVAEEKGIFAVGQSSDMSRFGPKSHLTAIVEEWGRYYTDRVNKVLAGTWKSEDTWGGIKSGMVRIADYNPIIPKDVVVAAEEIKAGIMAGTHHPFTGPIKDQAGNVKIAAGKTATDEEILKMDWFVEGVVGNVPK